MKPRVLPSLWTAAALLAAAVSLSHGADLKPFFVKHCLKCHDSGTEDGGLSLEGVSDFSSAKPEVWAAVRDQLQLRQMPPKKKDQPSEQERSAAADWIGGALRAAGHHVENKLELPNFGNYVPHGTLFGDTVHPAPATRVRLWRVRPEVYASKIRTPGAVQPFSLLPNQQISDFNVLYALDGSSTEIILRNAQQVVEGLTRFKLGADGAPLAEGAGTQGFLLPLVDPRTEPSEEAFTKALRWMFQWALHRDPDAAEAGRARALYEKIASAYGRVHAGRAVLVMPLLLPEAVYRLELGAGPLDEHGRRRLSRAEILNALQNTLFGGIANSALQTAKASPAKWETESRDQVAELVAELLKGDKPNRRLLDFFDEYFDYKKAVNVFKDKPAGFYFDAGALCRDTSRFIEMVVAADTAVLQTLLTSNRTFIAQGPPFANTNHQRVYNLPQDFKLHAGLVDLSPEERAGVLTHPSWLVAHSGNFDNDPVRRGKWILEHLLGGTVPELPVTVCAAIPADDTKTLRERFERIRNDSYCWRCHTQMNSIGMAFEQYDHFGRYRLQEKNKPVDTLGAILAIGDPKLEGPVANPIELIHRIADSPRVRQVFVRYAFRFFVGRNETERDAKTLQEAERAYVKEKGSAKALVVSLLSSDSFLFRCPE